MKRYDYFPLILERLMSNNRKAATPDSFTDERSKQQVSQMPGVKGFDNALVKTFPNVINVYMSLTVNQVQRVLARAFGVVT